MKPPWERFHDLMASISDEDCAEIDARLADPNYQPSQVEWRDDPDPFGMDWKWAKPSEGETTTTAETESPSGEPTSVIPFTGRSERPSSSRRVAYAVGGALAASLLIGAGALIGGSLFRGSGVSPVAGRMDVLVASVIPQFGTTRGTEGELRIQVQAGRPGFLTVISLAPSRPQQVFPRPGSEEIRLDESLVTTVGPLPPDSRTALVVITETGSTALIRKALLGKDYRADDFMRLQSDLVKALSDRGDRRASVGITQIEQPKS